LFKITAEIAAISGVETNLLTLGCGDLLHNRFDGIPENQIKIGEEAKVERFLF
jgi:hypothetical protein